LVSLSASCTRKARIPGQSTRGRSWVLTSAWKAALTAALELASN
jgi:hypothetical protein